MQSLKLFVQSFVPAFFCFTLMIMATVLWVSPVSRSREMPAQSYFSLPSEEETLTLLAIHAEDTLQSLTVLSIQPQQGQILLHSFPPETIINGETLSELWEQQELTSLDALLSAYTDLSIQRHLTVNDRQLFALLESFCSITAVLEQPLHYTQAGLTVTLEPGTHRLNSQQCLYYLQSAPNSSLRARRCEELLQNALNEHWPILASAQAQESFLKLLDLCDSDLTISDFDRCGEACAFMAQLVENPAVIQQSAAS